VQPWTSCLHTCAYVIKQYTLVPALSWKGNRMSGVELAMRHRQQWYFHLWAQGRVYRKWASPHLHTSGV